MLLYRKGQIISAIRVFNSAMRRSDTNNSKAMNERRKVTNHLGSEPCQSLSSQPAHIYPNAADREWAEGKRKVPRWGYFYTWAAQLVAT